MELTIFKSIIYGDLKPWASDAVNEKFYRNYNLCVNVRFTADGNKNIYFDEKEYECDQILLMKSGGFKQYNGNRVTF